MLVFIFFIELKNLKKKKISKYDKIILYYRGDKLTMKIFYVYNFHILLGLPQRSSSAELSISLSKAILLSSICCYDNHHNQLNHYHLRFFLESSQIFCDDNR